MRTIFNYPFLIEVDKNGNLMLNSGLTSRYLFKHELEELKGIVDKTSKYYKDNSIENKVINETNDILHSDAIELMESSLITNKKKTKKDRETFIYLAKNTKTNTLKIGKSKDVNNRLSVLNTASADKIIFLYSFRSFESKELSLHEKYKKCRLNGEWFSFNQSIIDEFKLLSK
jgi:hypothetical protein